MLPLSLEWSFYMCLSVSGFLQIPLKPALFYGSVLTLPIKLFVLSLLKKKQNKSWPLLSNPSPFSPLFSLRFLFMTIWCERAFSWKQSTTLDVFLKSSLRVLGHLFLICGAVMFVQPPAEALCGLMWKVLRLRNVIGGLLLGFFLMIWMQSWKMLAPCHKLSRLYSASGKQVLSAKGIHVSGIS